MKYERKHPK